MQNSGKIRWMLALILLCMAGIQVSAQTENSAQLPKNQEIGRIDLRDEPFSKLTDVLEQVTGRKVEIDPRLERETVFMSLHNVTLSAVLDVALPCQGATYELGEGQTLRLLPLPSPWLGPAKTEKIVSERARRRRKLTRPGLISLQQLTLTLTESYGINCLADVRIDPLPLRPVLSQANLEETLESILIPKGLDWTYSQGILVLMPSHRDRILNFKSPLWENWTYENAPMSEVAADLAQDLGLSINLVKVAANIKFSGKLTGRTVESIIDTLCRKHYLMYGVYDGELFLARRDQVSPMTYKSLPPQLTADLQWWSVPPDIWEGGTWDTFIADTEQHDELDRHLSQLSAQDEPILLLKEKLDLKDKIDFEKTIQIQPSQTTQPVNALLSSRYRFLENLYGLWSVRLLPEELTPQRIQPWFDLWDSQEGLIRFNRPVIMQTELPKGSPENWKGLLVIQFQAGDSDKPFHSIQWYIPRGYNRLNDAEKTGYYQEFPGSFQNLFLPNPFQPREVKNVH